MRILSAALLIALLAPLAASAQVPGPQTPGQAQGDSIKGVELKGKAPVNPQTLRVRLPRAQERTLANGLRVFLLEDHELPTFSLQLVILSGGLEDPADKHGLAMVTAGQLREGAGQRTSRQIAEQLAALGGSVSAGASPSSGETSVGVSGLIENIDPILEIAADVVRNPKFPQEELDKFKTRYVAQLQYQRSLPGFLAQEQFMRAIYGSHPGSYVVPPEATIKDLKSADLARYHASHYKPNNAFLVAYGDLKLADLVSKLERALGGWSKGEVGVAKLPSLTPPAKPRVMLIERPNSVQTSLWLGSLGIERNDPDYFPVLVMNHILGGGPASRLFLNLREEKGYTYGVSSFFSGSSYPGVMAASTDVRTEVTEGAMQELVAELTRIGNEPVSPQELTNAKRALVGRFALSLDSPGALIGNLVTQKVYNLPADYWDTYPQRVEAVTSAEIQRVAKKYYDSAHLQIVAVGDGNAMAGKELSVRKALEKYGTVESPGAAAAD
jgi:predicted Zn-dependent peptidase